VSKGMLANNLSPDQAEKEKAPKSIDHVFLRRFIESRFPIYKTDIVLKVAEYWEELPEHQREYDRYAGKLSMADIDLLIEGIKASFKE
jgi:hypothetical protein